jgi:Fe-S-cluster containining protein
VHCCETKPGALIPGDLERIAEHLGETFDNAFVERYFLASPGALVLYAGEPMRVPAIVPKLTEHGCVFLKDGKCSIHSASPFGCAYFDMHMTRQEGDGRSKYGVAAQANGLVTDNPYRRAMEHLCDVDQVATPLTERVNNQMRRNP